MCHTIAVVGHIGYDKNPTVSAHSCWWPYRLRHKSQHVSPFLLVTISATTQIPTCQPSLVGDHIGYNTNANMSPIIVGDHIGYNLNTSMSTHSC